jgi:D-amino-acid dehydrogenase
MGCGSGRAIADIVSGRRPDLDFAFTGIPQHEARVPLVSVPARS